MKNLLFYLSIAAGFFFGACSVGEKNLSLKPPKHGYIYVVAHRGAHNGIPENSIPAYQKAIDLGVDFVEIDVRTTRDGRYVSIHNRTIDAYVEDASGEIKNFTLAELKSFDIGLRIGQEWEGTRIPTFEEILDLCRNKCGVYLDLKDAPIAPLVSLIRERNMTQDVIWCLADIDEMNELVISCPECILMPDPGDEDEFSEILKRFKPIVVAPVWNDFSKELVEICHAAGALVIVDERDKTSWPQALEWGADGIQTDHPKELIEFIDKNRRKE